MPWTTITNAQLAVGAPIRSVDLLGLRDNITAQANGDVGAPQQQTAGIADNAVTAAKVNKGNGIGASGTQLVVACPTFNTVGSYCFMQRNEVSGSTNSGGNIAAGSGFGQAQSASIDVEATHLAGTTNNLSGTWKWMGNNIGGARSVAIGCRVS